MKLVKDTTQRGFGRIEFRDRNNTPCSLQESSLATQSAIWLGCDVVMDTSDISHPVVDKEVKGVQSVRMHLTRNQAEYLATVLLHFADTGELVDEGWIESKNEFFEMLEDRL